jgi:hypothetical protein
MGLDSRIGLYGQPIAHAEESESIDYGRDRLTPLAWCRTEIEIDQSSDKNSHAADK